VSLHEAGVEALGADPDADVPIDDRPGLGLWQQAGRRLIRDRGAMVGLGLVLAFVLVAIFAPFIASEPPTQSSDLARLGGACCPGPSSQHWFGLDEQGRDLFSRIVFGTRTSLLIAIVSVSFGLVAGMTLGAAAGYLGGVVDAIVMRIIDVMLAIPSLLFAIGLVALLGPGLIQIMIAVGVVSIPVFARLLRGSILTVRESDHVLAARSLGLRSSRVLFVHVLPNSLSPLIVAATLALGTAIVEVAGLGFLGLGNPDPRVPEWGAMLSNTPRFLASAPHLALFPGLAIVISVLGFNLLGDGLRDALDPRFRR
jgi:peptide/nickel transport system permease protein